MAEDLGLRHLPGPGALGGPHYHPQVLPYTLVTTPIPWVFEATYNNFNSLRPREGWDPQIALASQLLDRTRSPFGPAGRKFSLFSRVVAEGLFTSKPARDRNPLSPGPSSPNLFTLAFW